MRIGGSRAGGLARFAALRERRRYGGGASSPIHILGRIQPDKSEENARETIMRKVLIWGQASLPRGRNGGYFRWRELEREQQCHERLEQSAGTDQKCFILHPLTERREPPLRHPSIFFLSLHFRHR